MRSSKIISLCGVFSAVSVVLMLFTGIFPFSTFLMPAISGFVLFALSLEVGRRNAIIAFFAVAIISFLTTPDREAAVIFTALLGYYPIAKCYIEKIRYKQIAYVVKVVLFNASIASVYYLAITLFSLEELVAEFAKSGSIMVAAFIVVANLTFLVYDYSLHNLTVFYHRNIRNKIKL